MIPALILLIFSIYIRLTRLIEDSTLNIEFDADKRLYLGSIGLDWDKSAKIKKAIAANKDDKDEEKDFWEKNRWLNNEKKRQKRATKIKKKLCGLCLAAIDALQRSS